MKLALYSDQVSQDRKMDTELLKLLGNSCPSIGYIPSCSDLSRKYFQQRVEYYKDLGINQVYYCDLDQEYDPASAFEVLSCDAIHLSGGNTYYFLNTLKQRGFLEPLRSYVRSGGVLIGVSAGSIMTAPTIDIARFGDEDIVRSKDNSALGLVDFEFAPHWDGSDAYLEKIQAYARSKKKTVFLCKDGDGVIVNKDAIQLIGDVARVE